MRKAARAVAVTLAVLAGGAANARAQLVPVRLQGTFAMSGTVAAQDVYGEHTGERVSRTWNFLAQCDRGPCGRVLLQRKRSGQHILDVVMLIRQPSGLYVGQGQFWVPLDCAGQVESRGGLASETITVRVTRTKLIGTTRFAAAISATYVNTSRVNLTHCPGAIGQDAAQYQGQLVSPRDPASPASGPGE